MAKIRLNSFEKYIKILFKSLGADFVKEYGTIRFLSGLKVLFQATFLMLILLCKRFYRLLKK